MNDSLKMYNCLRRTLNCNLTSDIVWYFLRLIILLNLVVRLKL